MAVSRLAAHVLGGQERDPGDEGSSPHAPFQAWGPNLLWGLYRHELALDGGFLPRDWLPIPRVTPRATL